MEVCQAKLNSLAVRKDTKDLVSSGKMSQQFICVDNSSNSPTSSSSATLIQSLHPEVENSNKICQWMCCYCGQSYGSIMYTSVDPRIPPLEYISYHKEEPNYKYQGMSKVFNLVILEDNRNQNTEGLDQRATRTSTEIIPNNINNEDESNINKRIILSVPKRFVCHRCHHMMCPYCKKIRLKDIDENGINI